MYLFFPPFVRFYFRNWHGNTEGESSVWRHCISKLRGSLSPQKIPGGTPLLDAASLDYLFYQVIILIFLFFIFFKSLNLTFTNTVL